MNTELIEVLDSVTGDINKNDSLIMQADNLAAQHEKFHKHFIVGGRAVLYELIGKIYALAERLDTAADREGQLELMKTVLAQKHGIRTQENTSDTTVLVRYITKADRKTAHVYSRSIESARQNGIPSGNFVGFVEKAGGIERIRSNAAVSSGAAEASMLAESLEEKIKIARDYLQARTELPLASFRLPKGNIQEIRQEGLTHFICHERNGRQYVLAQLNIDNVQESSMVKDFAKELCSDMKEAKKQVSRFYEKAMRKRKQRTVKEIMRRRPEIGARLRRSLLA